LLKISKHIFFFFPTHTHTSAARGRTDAEARVAAVVDQGDRDRAELRAELKRIKAEAAAARRSVLQASRSAAAASVVADVRGELRRVADRWAQLAQLGSAPAAAALPTIRAFPERIVAIMAASDGDDGGSSRADTDPDQQQPPPSATAVLDPLLVDPAAVEAALDRFVNAPGIPGRLLVYLTEVAGDCERLAQENTYLRSVFDANKDIADKERRRATRALEEALDAARLELARRDAVRGSHDARIARIDSCLEALCAGLGIDLARIDAEAAARRLADSDAAAALASSASAERRADDVPGGGRIETMLGLIETRIVNGFNGSSSICSSAAAAAAAVPPPSSSNSGHHSSSNLPAAAMGASALSGAAGPALSRVAKAARPNTTAASLALSLLGHGPPTDQDAPPPLADPGSKEEDAGAAEPAAPESAHQSPITGAATKSAVAGAFHARLRAHAEPARRKQRPRPKR
jgi:hypothetical protein